MNSTDDGRQILGRLNLDGFAVDKPALFDGVRALVHRSARAHVKWVTGLSYRLKIPLAITVVIVLTEGVVTAALLTSASADAQRDLESSALNLAAVLARSVREPILRDDLWQAYEVIRTPLEVRSPGNPLQSIVIFDAANRVFVASDPKRLPVFASADTLPAAQRASLLGGFGQIVPFRCSGSGRRSLVSFCGTRAGG